jgi:hypothetical protein
MKSPVLQLSHPPFRISPFRLKMYLTGLLLFLLAPGYVSAQCTVPATVAEPACPATCTNVTSGNQTIATGATQCFSGTAGTLTVGENSTLIVCGTLTVSSLNMDANNATVVVRSGGNLTVSNNLTWQNNAKTIRNYGTITFNQDGQLNGGSGVQLIDNYGTLNFRDFTMQNSVIRLYNRTTGVINFRNLTFPSANAANAFINQGQISVAQQLSLNTNTQLCVFENSCISTRDFSSNGSIAYGGNASGIAVLSYTGAINVNTALTSSNRIRVCQGSANTTSNWGAAIVTPNCTFTSCAAALTALPVELLYFHAKAAESRVELTWATNSEKNNAYFGIERSANGHTYEEVGRVDGAGNSRQQKTYSFVDNAPLPGLAYYRLKQLDTDGTFTYSKIAAVENPQKLFFTVIPNPVQGKTLHLLLAGEPVNEVEVQIHNSLGSVILTQVYSVPADGSLIIPLVSGFNPGMYVVDVRVNGERLRQKFILP